MGNLSARDTIDNIEAKCYCVVRLKTEERSQETGDRRKSKDHINLTEKFCLCH